ncbi:hypothetical protein Pyn_39023 [Prunus yedoensis var. nudiflora]|uniref:Uncharacterized protein n=1 Tax=Prunus yedoensis var. nudiflora TaxID=2094558 RepID=A0A314V0E7_PRUYE|nr:hypothetical protein Pyn_39023 [Prunus yedoensis var. nudiflora]
MRKHVVQAIIAQTCASRRFASSNETTTSGLPAPVNCRGSKVLEVGDLSIQPRWKTSRKKVPLDFSINQPTCFLAERDDGQVILNGDNPSLESHVGQL